VDCGGFVFTVFITRISWAQMNLVPGVEVSLTFKATSVHLLPLE
jgi:molybdopterin-binding protein